MSTAEHLQVGQILVEQGLITDAQMRHCREIQDAEVALGGPRRMIGDILVEQNCCSAAHRDAAVGEQRRRVIDSTIGPYRITDKLGQGGMGAVYRARIPDSNIEVALKLLPRKLAADPNYLARFRREALIGVSMNHPSIVRTVDFGEYRGTFYLAMEIVEGGTLDDRLRGKQAFEEHEAFSIAVHILDALQYAHERGLIHRDVKPSNILFDRSGSPKLSDFGLAKDRSPDPSFMTAGYTVGTPHYMAPEQARAQRDIDIRADLYSLGATLYHLVTGTTPYHGSSAQLLSARAEFAPVPSPRQLNRNLSIGASAVIAKLMARDRANRYATPAEARADINRLLAGEAPLALPTPDGDHSGFMRVVGGEKPRGIIRTATSRRRKPMPRWLLALLLILVGIVGIGLGILLALTVLR